MQVGDHEEMLVRPVQRARGIRDEGGAVQAQDLLRRGVEAGGVGGHGGVKADSSRAVVRGRRVALPRAGERGDAGPRLPGQAPEGRR